MSPLVSVVLPVRNGASYILESASSILRQTYLDWELIIIDNGSTDGTPELCESLKDKRIRFAKNPGEKTIAGSLNLGIDMAHGAYIARIDADDVALPQRLSKQVAVLESNPGIGLVGSWMETFGQRRTIWRYPVRNPDIQLAMLFGSPFGHPSVMFRKDWDADSTGHYDASFDLAEDFELWTRISRKWECANLPEELTLYRTHTSQSTKRDSDAREFCVHRIRETHHHYLGVTLLPEKPSPKEFRDWWRYLETFSSENHLFEGANFRQQKFLQTTLLLRKRIKAILQSWQLLEALVRIRNFLERKLSRHSPPECRGRSQVI